MILLSLMKPVDTEKREFKHRHKAVFLTLLGIFDPLCFKQNDENKECRKICLPLIQFLIEDLSKEIKLVVKQK